MVALQRVVIYNEPGKASVLQVERRPVPQRAKGEVLVKQYSTSVNPVDVKMRQRNKDRVSKIPGGDIAGHVLEAESDGKFRKGDRVFGLAPWYSLASPEGTYAEFVSAKEEWLASVPSRLPLHEAGQVPLISLTAWQAMSGWDIQPGSRVLVHAGSSGVGNWVVQLAKVRGAHVIATAGPTNQKFLKELGADEAVDYQSQDFAELYKNDPFDFIFDSVGGDNTVKGYDQLLKKSGAYTEISNSGSHEQRTKAYLEQSDKGEGPTYKFMRVQPNGAWLQQISDLIQQGKLRWITDRSYDLFTQVREATEYLETGHARGKVVLEIQKEQMSTAFTNDSEAALMFKYLPSTRAAP